MKFFIILLLTSIFITGCSLNKVVKKHGVRNLENKQKELTTNLSNINDVYRVLGPPSTKSTFDNDIWIFIEREISNQKITKLSREKLLTNNVLILEIDSRGLLVKKDFYNINKMNDIQISSITTKNTFTKRSFIYDFLSSMRQKINDPLNKRKKTTD